MREPFCPPDCLNDLWNCLKHFEGPVPPTKAELILYLRHFTMSRITAEMVVCAWHGRDINRRHAAAMEVIMAMPFDDILPKFGPSPAHYQRALQLVRERIQSTPEIFSLPAPVCDLASSPAKSWKDEARLQLQQVTFVEVITVWRKLRQYKLPPFPPELGPPL